MSSIGIVSLRPQDLTWDKAMRLFLLRCRSNNLSAGTQALYTIRLNLWREWLSANGNPQPSEIRADNLRGFLEANLGSFCFPESESPRRAELPAAVTVFAVAETWSVPSWAGVLGTCAAEDDIAELIMESGRKRTVKGVAAGVTVGMTSVAERPKFGAFTRPAAEITRTFGTV